MTNDKYESKRHRITRIGVVLTILWFGGAALYAWKTGHRVEEFLWSDLNLVGDFLAGFFAPLAFGWLVIGYFLQSLELRMQREALDLQREETSKLVVQATAQADAIKANEAHARRDTFLRFWPAAGRELHDVIMEICVLIYTPNQMDRAREKFQGGQTSVFMEMVIASTIRGQHTRTIETLKNYMGGKELLRRYKLIYLTLLDEAKSSDPTGGLAFLVEASMTSKVQIAVEILLNGMTEEKN